MRTIPYSEIKLLAADLAGRPRDKLPVSEALMLRAYFAAELPDLWRREAWPELCDHIEAVSLDANNCFDTREGDANEMGDILAIIVGGNPMTNSMVTVLDKTSYTRLNDRVNVTSAAAGDLYVDWQTPPPDLLDNTDLGIANDAALDAYELPARFKLALAARGAALLIADENPGQAGVLRGIADAQMARQAQLLANPWWRK